MTKCVCGSVTVLHLGAAQYCARCFAAGRDFAYEHPELKEATR